MLAVCNLAKSISTSKTITTVGEVDFNVGPMPHFIATMRFVGIQGQKSKPGNVQGRAGRHREFSRPERAGGKSQRLPKGAAGRILI
jgi:hypothetical protein